jgi:hypothetical protein
MIRIPETIKRGWMKVRNPNMADEKHLYAFDFECWKRK